MSGEGIVGGGIDLNANARSAAFDPTQYLSFVQRFDNEPAASDEVIAPYTYAGLPTSTVMTFPYLSVSTIQTGQFQNLSVQLDLELGADPAITYNVTNYAFRHFFSRIGYGSQVHQVSIMLKDINGESLFYSACEFTSSSSNPACVLDSFQQAISGVRTVTIIHKLKSGITTSSNYAEYLLGLDDIRITTDQVVTPPPTATPTPTATPEPGYVNVEFSVVGIANLEFTNNQVSGINDPPLPLPEKIIPYADTLDVQVTITNLSDQRIVNGVLDIQNVVSQQNPSYTDVIDHPLRVVYGGQCCGTDGTQPRLQLANINLEIGESTSIHLALQARRTGRIEATYIFTSDTVSEPEIRTVEIIEFVDTTRISFEDVDARLKVAIFWAIFNEASEGNFISYNSSNISCLQPGWTTSEGIEILDIVRFEDLNTTGCRSIEYLDAQTMINGILSYERSPGSDHPFFYFSSNFEASLGNHPREGGTCYYDAVERGTPLYGYCDIWVRTDLWPYPADIGLEDNSIEYEGRVGYQTLVDSERQDRNGDAILRWLEYYLNSYMNFVEPLNDKQSSQRNFYERVYLDQDSIINHATQDLITYCPQNPPINLADTSASDTVLYRLCDPTLGALQRKGGNVQGVTNPYNINIDGCLGDNDDTPLEIFANSEINFEIPLMQHLDRLENGDLSINVPSYAPDFNSILYPVIFFQRSRDSEYNINGCTWTNVIYQQDLVPYNYPR